MRDYANEARQILSVYLQRGTRALAELRAGAFDKADELLRLRAAAFHNFRALDAQAGADGIDLGVDAGLISLAAGLQSQQDELAEALAQAHAVALSQYTRIRETRKSIGLFRSTKSAAPQAAPTKIERAV